MKKKVSIVIPTYNEKGNIIRLLSAIKKQDKNSKEFTYEVLVVDDNSPDGTADSIKKKFRSPFVKLIVRTNEKGLGTAIKAGILASSGEIIVGMDADFNHDPAILPSLLSQLKNSDLVVASRFIKGGGMDDKARYVSTLLFNLVLKYVLGFPSTDNFSGYYAVKKKDLKKLGIERIYYGYGDYHLRLVYFAKLSGLKISEVPVYYKERLYGQSKSKLLRLVIAYLKEAVKLKLVNEK